MLPHLLEDTSGEDLGGHFGRILRPLCCAQVLALHYAKLDEECRRIIFDQEVADEFVKKNEFADLYLGSATGQTFVGGQNAGGVTEGDSQR